MIIEFPGALPAIVVRALSDERIPLDARDALRTLANGKDEDRPDALDVVRDSIGGDGDDIRGLRLFPALVALARLRESFERLALAGTAGSIELVRLAVAVDIPDDLAEEWEAARKAALQLLGPLLADDLDPALLAPLLAAVAALQGAGELAGVIASADELIGSLDDEAFDDDDDDGVDDDDDDDGEEEEEDDDEGKPPF